MLFVGDDWAEDHHDVEVQDERGPAAGRGPAARGGGGDRPAARADRRASPTADDEPRTAAGGGRDRDRPRPVGARRWSRPAIRCSRSTRCRRPGTGSGTRISGAKSDAGDAHVLAEMVRTDAHQLRPVAGDSRAGRGGQGGRPGAPDADLGTDPARAAAAVSAAGVLPRRAGGVRRTWTAPDALELLAKAPDPAPAARLTRGADHRGAAGGPAAATSPAKADAIQAALRAAQLRQPPARGRPPTPPSSGRQVAVIDRAERRRSRRCKGRWRPHFGQHPDAEIYLSQPGLGVDPRRPGARRVRRRPAPLRRRQGPQELRRHHPDHPRVGQARRSSWPATSATTASSTRCSRRPSPR